MAKEIEVRMRAEELYIIDGMTINQVAGAVNVSERTLENWSIEGNWKALQQEYQGALKGIKRYTVLTKLKLIKDAMTSLDPQKIYAFAALERAAKGNTAEEAAPFSDAEAREIRTAEDAVSALQEAVERKLNIMLSQPKNISLAGVRDMKKALELLEQMRPATKKEGTAKKQLDPETLRIIREEVYGLV